MLPGIDILLRQEKLYVSQVSRFFCERSKHGKQS